MLRFPGSRVQRSGTSRGRERVLKDRISFPQLLLCLHICKPANSSSRWSRMRRSRFREAPACFASGEGLAYPGPADFLLHPGGTASAVGSEAGVGAASERRRSARPEAEPRLSAWLPVVPWFNPIPSNTSLALSCLMRLRRAPRRRPLPGARRTTPRSRPARRNASNGCSPTRISFLQAQSRPR